MSSNVQSATVAAVIFDMDGLMFDTEVVARMAWRKALADHGLQIGDEAYIQIVGRTQQDTTRILREVLGDELPVEEIRARKIAHLEAHLEQHGVPLKPGLAALLDELDELRLPRAVASSTYRAIVERRLAVTGLRQRFHAVVGGDQVAQGKPAPDIYLAAREQLGVPAEGCLVLEDSAAGIQAAHAAGMIPVLVPDLVPSAAATVALAYRVVASLSEVSPVIRSLTPSPQRRP